MLTPCLEKLVLCGKASYNTFVAGGAQKHILNVKNDRFIIITDLTYYCSVNVGARALDMTLDRITDLFTKHLNTQLKIFSTKSQNAFLFRNNVLIQPINRDNTSFNVSPIGHVKLDTYLIHESDVSFTFSYAGARRSVTNGTTKAESIAFPPPFDYGKDGQPGALNIEKITADGFLSLSTLNGGQLEITGGQPENLELSFPVDSNTIYDHVFNSWSQPIVQIGYVEILGNPTNISATL
jgi:hypothetical protein